MKYLLFLFIVTIIITSHIVTITLFCCNVNGYILIFLRFVKIVRNQKNPVYRNFLFLHTGFFAPVFYNSFSNSSIAPTFPITEITSPSSR